MAARNFKNLVFEGGGIKGIAYGGALEVLDRVGVLSNIIRVGGTSAGAINAALLALGYTVKQVSDIIAATDFSTFADGGTFLSKIPRLLRSYGINKGDAFGAFIRRKIAEITGKEGYTFRDLRKDVEAGKAGLKDLYIVVTDLTRQKPVIFSHEDTGTANVPVWLAVRMSMSIPLYFQSVKSGESVIVDGGVSYNYAVNIFDDTRYLSRIDNGLSDHYPGRPGKVFNYETLGFRLDSQQVIKYSHDDWAIPPQKVGNIREFAGALLNFLMEMANKSHLNEADWNRTVFIDTLDVKTTDFSISKKKIEELVDSGRRCTERYFNWRDKEIHWSSYPQ